MKAFRINNKVENVLSDALIHQQPKIYIIHENDIWLNPLRDALNKLQQPYQEIFVNEGSIDLNQIPPEGIYYNRMSASSHTRGNRYAVELTAPLTAWLEANGKRLINNRRAMQLEVRKFEQYISLQQFGIIVPKTIAAHGKEEVLAAAKSLGETTFVVKPNRGGKGLGVTLFNSIKELEKTLNNSEIDTLDGILLVQQYIKPKNNRIIRTEFIGGKFYYAVAVDTSDGFELCPADTCQVGSNFCPIDAKENKTTKKSKFEILDNYSNPDLEKYEAFLAANGIEIGAIEYVEGEGGERYVYDVNINTNYNSIAEKASGLGLYAMEEIAAFLSTELAILNAKKRTTIEVS